MENGSEERFEIERGQRLSRSSLWPMQRAYYQKHGVEAWRDGVIPSYITSNTFMAQSFARTVVAYLHDWLNANKETGDYDPSQPIHVIELGSGPGRFAFLFLKKLVQLLEVFGPTRPRVRYLLTDFTDTNFDFWRDHPGFEPFFREGLLDFAHFDANKSESLRLERSGETLSLETQVNPLVVIANYLFDSLTIDAFCIKEGVLHESLVTLSSSQVERDLTDPELISRLEMSYEHVPIGPDYYEDAGFNAILQTYRETLDDTAIAFPVGALACIKNLARLSRGRMLVLATDKGVTDEEDLIELDDPVIEVHGSFSFTVNFHALGLYVEHLGGFSMQTATRDATLAGAAFVLGGPKSAFPSTRLAFSQNIDAFGPTDFFELQQTLRDIESITPPLALSLGLLRLSDWDPRLFYIFSDGMMDQIESASQEQKRDLRRALVRVWENHFPIGTDYDLAFEIARVFWRLNAYSDAMLFYWHSLRLAGEHFMTYHNLGICHHALSEYEEALRMFDRALELHPHHGPSKAWRIRTRADRRAAQLVAGSASTKE